MKRPIIDKEVVYQAKTIYEQTLTSFIVNQSKYIDYLESRTKILNEETRKDEENCHNNNENYDYTKSDSFRPNSIDFT